MKTDKQIFNRHRITLHATPIPLVAKQRLHELLDYFCEADRLEKLKRKELQKLRDIGEFLLYYYAKKEKH